MGGSRIDKPVYVESSSGKDPIARVDGIVREQLRVTRKACRRQAKYATVITFERSEQEAEPTCMQESDVKRAASVPIRASGHTRWSEADRNLRQIKAGKHQARPDVRRTRCY